MNRIWKSIGLLSFAAFSLMISAAEVPEKPIQLFSPKQTLGLFEVESAELSGTRELLKNSYYLRTYLATVVVKESLPAGAEKKRFKFGVTRPEESFPDPFIKWTDVWDGKGAEASWFPPKKGGHFIAIFDPAKGPGQHSVCLESYPTGYRHSGKNRVPEAWKVCKAIHETVSSKKGKEAERLAKLLDERKPWDELFFRVIRVYDERVFDNPEFCQALAGWLTDPKVDLDARLNILSALKEGPEGRGAATEEKLIEAYLKLGLEAKKAKRRPMPDVSNTLRAIERQFVQRRWATGKPLPKVSAKMKPVLKELAEYIDGKYRSTVLTAWLDAQDE